MTFCFLLFAFLSHIGFAFGMLVVVLALFHLEKQGSWNFPFSSASAVVLLICVLHLSNVDEHWKSYGVRQRMLSGKTRTQFTNVQIKKLKTVSHLIHLALHVHFFHFRDSSWPHTVLGATKDIHPSTKDILVWTKDSLVWAKVFQRSARAFQVSTKAFQVSVKGSLVKAIQDLQEGSIRSLVSIPVLASQGHFLVRSDSQEELVGRSQDSPPASWRRNRFCVGNEFHYSFNLLVWIEILFLFLFCKRLQTFSSGHWLKYPVLLLHFSQHPTSSRPQHDHDKQQNTHNRKFIGSLTTSEMYGSDWEQGT